MTLVHSREYPEQVGNILLSRFDRVCKFALRDVFGSTSWPALMQRQQPQYPFVLVARISFAAILSEQG